jgi:hypothetical protein
VTEEATFQIRRGVLQFHRAPNSKGMLFLCWPVLAYRVTAPVLRVRHLNIIEKVVLALCQAGIRRSADIAAKIHQSEELCEYVLRQLRDQERIDQSGVPTEQGRQTLTSGKVGEEPEFIVTHVLQDLLTGRLWPRAATDLVFQRVHAVKEGKAQLKLDTPGEAKLITAHVVGDGLRLPYPRPPSAQEIIDAVNAHRKAELAHRQEQFTDLRDGRSPTAYIAERDLEALTTELAPPHESRFYRVSGTSRPMAEYLLIWLAEGDDPGSGPQVHDPFGLEPNPMARRLLTDWIRADAELGNRLRQAADDSFARATEDYRAAREAVGRAADNRLVRELGSGLRQRPKILDLLREVDDATARGGAAALESVAREAYRVYEHLFRRLVSEYPPPERPSWDAGSRTPAFEKVKAALRDAAKSLGLDTPQDGYLSVMKLSRAITQYPARYRQVHEFGKVVNIEKGFIRDLWPYVLIAAADPSSPHRRDHPMRALAADRPDLLHELDVLRELRNRGSHETRDATDDIDWCRQLALDAARVLISMPPPPSERN